MWSLGKKTSNIILLQYKKSVQNLGSENTNKK
jgi:hypothetical protein